MRSVHVGDELRKCVERRFLFAKVVPVRPARRDARHERCVRAHAPTRPVRRLGHPRPKNARAEIVESLLAYVDAKRCRFHEKEGANVPPLLLEEMRQSGAGR